MEIKNLFKEKALTKQVDYKYLSRDGAAHDETEPFLCEHDLLLAVDGQPTMNFTCIPTYLPEMILGYLMTEGLISGISDVSGIEICEDGSVANVSLAVSDTEVVRASVPQLDWSPDWIFDLADRFAEGMPLHSRTFATHSSFLSRLGSFSFSCEDLSRYVAFDKVVGYAMLNDIPLEECIIYLSGRIPVDMVEKALAAGLPLLSSKASPTFEAVELARAEGLPLICAARRDRMKIF